MIEAGKKKIPTVPVPTVPTSLVICVPALFGPLPLPPPHLPPPWPLVQTTPSRHDKAVANMPFEFRGGGAHRESLMISASAR